MAPGVVAGAVFGRSVRGVAHARQQDAFIEYLKAENRVINARLGGRRLILTDAERRLLARHAKAVGRKKLFGLDPIVSPDTLLRWHRQLIAMKWTFA